MVACCCEVGREGEGGIDSRRKAKWSCNDDARLERWKYSFARRGGDSAFSKKAGRRDCSRIFPCWLEEMEGQKMRQFPSSSNPSVLH